MSPVTGFSRGCVGFFLRIDRFLFLKYRAHVQIYTKIYSTYTKPLSLELLYLGYQLVLKEFLRNLSMSNGSENGES